MSHKCVPMSYPPKLEAVFAGKCRQTMRKGERYRVGDTITFFEWSGRPYRSKWGQRWRAILVEVVDVELDEDLILIVSGLGAESLDLNTEWDGDYSDDLAARDGIDPPTGFALRDTLKAMYGDEWEGPYQILRW